MPQYRSRPAASIANTAFTAAGAVPSAAAYSDPNNDGEQYEAPSGVSSSTTPSGGGNSPLYAVQLNGDGGGGGGNMDNHTYTNTTIDSTESSSDMYYSTVVDAPVRGGRRGAAAAAAQKTMERKSSVALDRRIGAVKQQRKIYLAYGVAGVFLLIAFILGAAASSRVAALSAKHDELAAKHDELAVKHDALSVKHDALSDKHTALAAELTELKDKDAKTQASGIAVPSDFVERGGSMPEVPECTSSTPPSIIYTKHADLGIDVMQSCTSLEGVPAWRPMMMLGGLVYDGSDQSGFVAAIGSGLPGVYLLQLKAAEMLTFDSALTIFPSQDAWIISKVAGAANDVIFNSRVIVNKDATLSLEDLEAVEFKSSVTLNGDATLSLKNLTEAEFRGGVTLNEDATLSLNDLEKAEFHSVVTLHPRSSLNLNLMAAAADVQFKSSVTFTGAVDNRDGGANLVILAAAATNITFESTLKLDANASVSILAAAATTMVFQREAVLEDGASLSIVTTPLEDGATAARVGFEQYFTLDNGAKLTVDGNVEVDAAYGLPLWRCTNAATNKGTCTLSNGVVFKMPDGRVLKMAGSLPGIWTATHLNGTTVGTISLEENSMALPTLSPPMWTSPTTDVYDSGSLVNKRGHRFKLYLLPGVPQTYSYTSGSRRMYEAACNSAGLMIVTSGYGNQYEVSCGGTPELCMPLPEVLSNNNWVWGYSDYVDDRIRDNTGWNNFVISHWSDKDYVWNNPSGSSGFETPKRPVCGKELGTRHSSGELTRCQSRNGCDVEYTFSNLGAVGSALLTVRLNGDFGSSNEYVNVNARNNRRCTYYNAESACAGMDVTSFVESGSVTVRLEATTYVSDYVAVMYLVTTPAITTTTITTTTTSIPATTSN